MEGRGKDPVTTKVSTMSLALFLLVAALILFMVAAFLDKSLLAAGLACATAYVLLG